MTNGQVSNKAYIYFRLTGIRYSAVVLLFLALSVNIGAQEQAVLAVLLRGPVSTDGIEFLSANVIPAYYGEYGYKGGIVRIYFTREEIVLPASWKASDCGIKGVFEAPAEAWRESRVFCCSDPSGWYAFAEFPSEAGFICSFLNTYRIRQNYFLNVSRDKNLFSFPAIMNPD